MSCHIYPPPTYFLLACYLISLRLVFTLTYYYLFWNNLFKIPIDCKVREIFAGLRLRRVQTVMLMYFSSGILRWFKLNWPISIVIRGFWPHQILILSSVCNESFPNEVLYYFHFWPKGKQYITCRDDKTCGCKLALYGPKKNQFFYQLISKI